MFHLHGRCGTGTYGTGQPLTSFTRNFVSHNFVTHISLTYNFVTHTQGFVTHNLSHTHTTLSHRTLSDTAPLHTTFSNNRSSNISLVFPAFSVPLQSTVSVYWKKMTCGVIRSFSSNVLFAKAAGVEPSGRMSDERSKIARRCGAKHISKSKRQKHPSPGTPPETEMHILGGEGQGADFLRGDALWSIKSSGFAKMILRSRCSTSYDLASLCAAGAVL